MSEQLDIYTYALMKGASFKVGSMGREWIARCIVPGCSSQHDAFSVQPEGKFTGRWAGYGAWMCRKCWDSKEEVIVEHGPERGARRKRGWGTIADLVMRCEGMNYKEAERFILEFEGKTVPIAARPPLIERKSDEQWFAESREYLRLVRQGTDDDKELIERYLASRGLTLETARLLGFGFSLDKVRLEDGSLREIPFLVIPWYKDKAAGTLYRKIGRRNLHEPRPEEEPKYKVRWQSDNDMLYLGETLLEQKRPTFLVESELCAATILQEAGDLVNVVATGSAIHGKGAVTEARLRRQPFVFVAFDTDEDGEKASKHWLGKLDSTKSIRYKPLAHDVNEMHTRGLSVRKWVEDGLTFFAPHLLPKPVVTYEHLVTEEIERVCSLARELQWEGLYWHDYHHCLSASGMVTLEEYSRRMRACLEDREDDAFDFALDDLAWIQFHLSNRKQAPQDRLTGDAYQRAVSRAMRELREKFAPYEEQQEQIA